jgi:two-component system, chemotaxis family, protein-glutamate methylesterase/glutaminase
VARQDIIVAGGSAGAVEALRTLVEGLPPDLDAAVLAVIHISPHGPGRLVEILQRRTTLRVRWARDGEPIERGRVYVAPPDRHLVVDDGHVHLTRAPRENHSRPAIDPLFRSAALCYGARVIGVVLSGRLDDGTAGLWAVKERGGTAVVQDPDDATQPDMPRNALAYTTADYVVPAAELGALLGRLVGNEAPDVVRAISRELEGQITMAADASERGAPTLGTSTPYTCPECHGVLVRVDQQGIPRYRCRTGHVYALDSLLASITESVESALWSALRAVEESALLLREAAAHGSEAGARAEGGGETDSRFEQMAREAQERAELIRQAVLGHQPLSLAAVRSVERAVATSEHASADVLARVP